MLHQTVLACSWRMCGAAVLGAFILAGQAHAEKWLKVMPDDPFSEKGSYHQFDIDSAFEDSATGYVAARMIYTDPAKAAGARSWFVWAFDCQGHVFFVSSPEDSGGTKVTDGWRTKSTDLEPPQMGGVTNVFGQKLCALKGSWPKGDLPQAK